MDGILKNYSMAEPNMWVEEDILRYVNTKKVFCNKNVPFDNAEWYVYQHPHKYLSSYKFVVPAICWPSWSLGDADVEKCLMDQKISNIQQSNQLNAQLTELQMRLRYGGRF